VSTLGQVNRTRVPARASLPQVIEHVNRLPFGFVGARFTRGGTVTAAVVNTWTAFTVTPVFDEDRFLMPDAQRAQIPPGGDGVYQIHVSARHINAGSGRLRITVNGAPNTVLAVSLLNSENTPRSSAPLVLRARDVVQWWYRTTDLAGVLAADTAAADIEASPSVSIVRLGLLP
jgi:hypothetical protein